VLTEQVVGLVVSLLQGVVKGLLRGCVPHGDDLEKWESVAFHCKALTTTINDLVAGEC
jgi:hypothetical protein